jgi:hypothetical protein
MHDSLPPPEDREARVSLVNTLLVLNTSVNLLAAKMDTARAPLPKLQWQNLVAVVALTCAICIAFGWLAMPRLAEATQQRACEEK